MVSASKAKRMAERGEKKVARASKKTESAESLDSNGDANGSVDDINMEKLKLHAERTATGVYTAQAMARDLKVESYSLNFHGRVLIDNATIELNFGRRYGLIGANGSGKSTFLASLAGRDIEIPNHIDVRLSSFFWVASQAYSSLDLPAQL